MQHVFQELILLGLFRLDMYFKHASVCRANQNSLSMFGTFNNVNFTELV